MSDMSPVDVAWKVEHEGGLFDAAFGYGIKAGVIDGSTEQGALLKAAWERMESAYHTSGFGAAFAEVGCLLDEIEDGPSD